MVRINANFFFAFSKIKVFGKFSVRQIKNGIILRYIYMGKIIQRINPYSVNKHIKSKIISAAAIKDFGSQKEGLTVGAKTDSHT